jgi:hypothetical protein
VVPTATSRCRGSPWTFLEISELHIQGHYPLLPLKASSPEYLCVVVLISPPAELVVSFEATPPSTVTPPYEPLIESFHAQLPQALVRDSRFIEEQLGSYSAQQLWLEAIKDNQRAVLSPEVCAVVRSWHPTRLLHVSDGAGKVVNVSQKVQHLVKIMLALLARTNHPNCVIYGKPLLSFESSIDMTGHSQHSVG